MSQLYHENTFSHEMLRLKISLRTSRGPSTLSNYFFQNLNLQGYLAHKKQPPPPRTTIGP